MTDKTTKAVYWTPFMTKITHEGKFDRLHLFYIFCGDEKSVSQHFSVVHSYWFIWVFDFLFEFTGDCACLAHLSKFDGHF